MSAPPTVTERAFRRCPACGGAIEITAANCPFCEHWCCPGTVSEDGTADGCGRVFEQELSFRSHYGAVHGGPYISADLREELHTMYVEEHHSIGHIHKHLTTADLSYATVREMLIHLGYHTPRGDLENGDEVPHWQAHESLSHTEAKIHTCLLERVEESGTCYISSTHLLDEIEMNSSHLGKELKSLALKVQDGTVPTSLEIERYNKGSPICWRVTDHSPTDDQSTTSEA